MAGEALGATGPIKLRNPGLLLDVRLAPGAALQQPVPPEWNGFAVRGRSLLLLHAAAVIVCSRSRQVPPQPGLAHAGRTPTLL